MSLPSGYKRLEYIKSSGTQYIDTGVSTPSGMRIQCEVDITSYNSSLNMLFGSHDTDAPYYRNYLAVTNGGKWEIGAYNPANFGVASIGTKYKIDVCTIRGSIFCKINGVDQGVSTALDNNIATRSARNVYLFGLNYTGGLLPASMRLYELTMYLDADAATPVRHFIPCKNSAGVIGLWDDTNSVFYQNSGSGTFTAGPEVKGTNKALIDGTAYDAKAGKCLVGGTAYAIKKGRALIDGTGYDIDFDNVINITWYMNTYPLTGATSSAKTYSIPFTSAGMDFESLDVSTTSIYYNKSDGKIAAFLFSSWNSQDYRTIIFHEEPTGDLLTWLETNGTRQ